MKLIKNFFCLSLCLVCFNVFAEEQEPAKPDLLANFEAADNDGNQALTAAEFKDFVAANAKADIGRFAMIKKRGAQDMVFSRMDRDDNGEVTLEELRTMRR